LLFEIAQAASRISRAALFGVRCVVAPLFLGALGKAFAEGSEENEESKSGLKNLRYLRFLLL
jgi:hypothetical protein